MQESNLPPVINTKRRHSAAFKRKILELIAQPGASVAAVALEYGVNANLVFKMATCQTGASTLPAGDPPASAAAGIR